MLSPVQNSPLPLEPMRQQLVQPSPVVTQPPAPLPMAAQPLPPSDTPRDKFAGRDGQQSNDDALNQRRQQQQYEATRELSSAWARLTVLQQMAHRALGEGNGPQAREAAIEAAAVASSIRDMASGLAGVDIGVVDIAAAIDNARTGISAAMQVINLADSHPDHVEDDRQAIRDARIQVLTASAGVESVAADLLPKAGPVAYGSGIDLRA